MSADNVMLKVHERLGSIEAKLDAALTKGQSIDRRVRRLENYKAKLAGIAAAVAGVVSLVGYGLKLWLGSK